MKMRVRLVNRALGAPPRGAPVELSWQGCRTCRSRRPSLMTYSSASTFSLAAQGVPGADWRASLSCGSAIVVSSPGFDRTTRIEPTSMQRHHDVGVGRQEPFAGPRRCSTLCMRRRRVDVEAEAADLAGPPIVPSTTLNVGSSRRLVTRISSVAPALAQQILDARRACRGLRRFPPAASPAARTGAGRGSSTEDRRAGLGLEQGLLDGIRRRRRSKMASGTGQADALVRVEAGADLRTARDDAELVADEREHGVGRRRPGAGCRRSRGCAPELASNQEAASAKESARRRPAVIEVSLSRDQRGSARRASPRPTRSRCRAGSGSARAPARSPSSWRAAS